MAEAQAGAVTRPRWFVNQTAKQRQLEQTRRAVGLCVTCGEDGEGFARCAICRKKNTLSVQRTLKRRRRFVVEPSSTARVVAQ